MKKRDIKFTGKNIDTGKWEEGFAVLLTFTEGIYSLCTEIGCTVLVSADTCRQHTGQILAKDRRVFSGDIAFEEIPVPEGEGQDIHMYRVCTWIEEYTCFAWLDLVDYQNYQNEGAEGLVDMYEIIERNLKTNTYHYAGNYIDNPELLQKTF